MGKCPEVPDVLNAQLRLRTKDCLIPEGQPESQGEQGSVQCHTQGLEPRAAPFTPSALHRTSLHSLFLLPELGDQCDPVTSALQTSEGESEVQR